MGGSVSCDSCGTTIAHKAQYWHCEECENFDLCENCKGNTVESKGHVPTHNMTEKTWIDEDKKDEEAPATEETGKKKLSPEALYLFHVFVAEDSISESHIQSLWDKYDSNTDGKLDFNEVLAFYNDLEAALGKVCSSKYGNSGKGKILFVDKVESDNKGYTLVAADTAPEHSCRLGVENDKPLFSVVCHSDEHGDVPGKANADGEAWYSWGCNTIRADKFSYVVGREFKLVNQPSEVPSNAISVYQSDTGNIYLTIVDQGNDQIPGKGLAGNAWAPYNDTELSVTENFSFVTATIENAELRKIFDEIDTDKNGTIEYEEFVNYIHKSLEPYKEDSYIRTKLKELDDKITSLPASFKDRRHEHSLTKVQAEEKYICKGCEQKGRGWSYHCNECDWRVHPDCAGNSEQYKAFEQKQRDALVDQLRKSYDDVDNLGKLMGLSEDEIARARKGESGGSTSAPTKSGGDECNMQ